MTSPLSNEVRAIPGIFYTQSARVIGTLYSIHTRFTDTLNTVDQDFVLLREAILQPLSMPKDEEMSSAALLVGKDQVVVAVPQEAQAGRELPPLRQGLRVDRQTMRVMIIAHPFVIHGELYIPPAVELLQHIHDPHHQFMTMGDASVVYPTNPLLGFKTPFLLVNRRHIEVALDMAQVGELTGVDPDLPESPVEDVAISGVRAAELLNSTAIFKMVDMANLQKVCNELTQQGRLGRKVCRGGAEVFHQGDLGDTLYVVEHGRLEVFVTDVRTNTDHLLSYFGPGDFFGEMAIIGEGRRTATVRAITDSSMLSVHEEAIKTLMQRFPSSTANLLGIMVQRQSGLIALGQ